MSQLTAVDISDSDRFELAEVLKEESESSSASRPLEDILHAWAAEPFSASDRTHADPSANRLSRARTNTTPVSQPSRLGIHAMRIRRHKLGQREETTEELSERVLARLRREYSLVSSEVWVDDVHRVDFVGFRPARNSPFPSSIERGEFVFVEVKSCMNDFKSGHGLTFRGDANWLVCPPDLAQTLYETRQLPKDAAVFCPDARGRLQKKFDLGIGSDCIRLRAPVPNGEPQRILLPYIARGLFDQLLPVVQPVPRQAPQRYR